jgi:hypothetical protein
MRLKGLFCPTRVSAAAPVKVLPMAKRTSAFMMDASMRSGRPSCGAAGGSVREVTGGDGLGRLEGGLLSSRLDHGLISWSTLSPLSVGLDGTTGLALLRSAAEREKGSLA